MSKSLHKASKKEIIIKWRLMSPHQCSWADLFHSTSGSILERTSPLQGRKLHTKKVYVRGTQPCESGWTSTVYRVYSDWLPAICLQVSLAAYLSNYQYLNLELVSQTAFSTIQCQNQHMTAPLSPSLITCKIGHYLSWPHSKADHPATAAQKSKTMFFSLII